jgi:hypothetical protein
MNVAAAPPQLLNDVPEAVIAFLLQRKTSAVSTKVPEVAIRVALHTAWKAINTLPVFTQFAQLLRTVRILGLAICPCPENHRDVFEYCPQTIALGHAQTSLPGRNDPSPRNGASARLDLKGLARRYARRPKNLRYRGCSPSSAASPVDLSAGPWSGTTADY